MGGLNFDTDERAVRERFERHGEVASVRILYDRDTRRSRGVAFVAFADAAAAEEAAEKENGREIDGRRVRCNLASRKPESPPWGGGWVLGAVLRQQYNKANNPDPRKS